MKCWILTVGEPVPHLDGPEPRLLRSAMLARTLAARGHSVVWWTSTFDHYRKVQRTDGDACLRWEGVTIHLMRSVGYPRNVSVRRIIEHRGVAKRFRQWCRTVDRPDIIVAALPTIELAKEGIEYGRAMGVPVLADVHDLWPDLLETVLPRAMRGLSRALLQPMYADAKQVLRGSASLMAVSAGYLDWALDLAGRARRTGDGVFELPYLPPHGEVANPEPGADEGPGEGVSVVLYVGSFGLHYDLAPVLTAARELEASGRSDVRFVIAGEGELGPRWRAMAEGLGNVRFTGWVEGPEIARLLKGATVALQPYSVEATQGLPNKLFEYLSAGLPVLSSLRGECQRLLSGADCGVTYRAGDAQDFRVKLEGMLSDPKRLAAMSRNAYETFTRDYDARVILERMADHVEEAVGVASPRWVAPVGWGEEASLVNGAGKTCWILTVGEPVPLVDGPEPRLLRSAMLARTLAARGHSVVWWTSSFDHYRKTRRSTGDACLRWGRVAIHLMRSVGYSRNVSLRRLREHREVALRFREWSRTEEVPDVIVASFPTIELAREGVDYGLEVGVPVIVDVRDLWPDLLATVLPKPIRGLSRPLLQPMYSDAKHALRGATSLVATSADYLSWALDRAGRGREDEDRVFELGYVPGQGAIGPGPDPGEGDPGSVGRAAVVLYVGSFGRQYDLAPVLTTAAELDARGRTDIRFVIAGDGELGSRWRTTGRRLGNVEFVGWVEGPEIARLLRTASVGLQPYAAEATQGLPNKLFEYLSAGLPVLSSLPGECERLLSEAGCGETFRAGDAEDFRAKLEGMLGDRTRLAAMSRRARETFERDFDARVILERMADHVEHLAEGVRT